MTPAERANEYIERGWAPIPVPHRSKKPVLDEWQKLRIQEADVPKYFDGPHLNIGVVLGAASGNLVDADLDCPEALILAESFLPPTESVFGRRSKPRSHRLYRSSEDPGATKRFGTKSDGTLVEFRANGGQTVMPGSTHESGEPVEWETDGKPQHVNADELLKAIAELAAACLLVRLYPGAGARHDFALALAGALFNMGFAVERVELMIGAIAAAAADEEADDRVRGVRDTHAKQAAGRETTGWPTLATIIGEDAVKAMRSWLGAEDARASTVKSLEETDMANAKRLVSRRGEGLRYVPTRDCFVHWTGTHWSNDDGMFIEKWAKETAASILAEIPTLATKRQRANRLAWAEKSQSRSRIEATIKLARSEPGIPVSEAEFDVDPLLLNVANGILDLRTGTLRPHDPKAMLSKLVNIPFDRRATCPRFVHFLGEIFDGNKQLIGFVQRAAGYCLSGDASERAFFILHGAGANGKSTLLDVFRLALGGYSRTTPAQTFLARRHDGSPRNDLAALRGTRLVLASEVNENRRLDVALVKAVTGGTDRIAARFLYGEFFEFFVTFKVWLAVNHRPVIDETSDAIWDRIYLIPFNVTIPVERRDRGLPAALQQEAPGILAWMVDGFLRWQKEGLNPPEEVRAARAHYRAESDVVGEFIDECCTVGPLRSADATPLYKAFTEWCDRVGREAVSQTKFGRCLSEKSFQKSRSSTNGRSQWLGLGVRP